SGWALPRNSQGLTGHDRVIFVRPHVELLNLVPELRLVYRTTHIAEPRRRVKLEIVGLIVLSRTVGRLSRTASASSAGHVVPDPVRITIIARQVGMPAQPRRGR